MNSKSTPPKVALKLLSWFCPDYLYEEIEGDLIQKFNKEIDTIGERNARRRLMWSVICFFRPGIVLRNRIIKPVLNIYMLANYFKIALRIMVRSKGYSMINVFGLAFGMTGAILLGLWIQNEFSYDQFHPNKDRLYTAWNKQLSNGTIHCWNMTPRVLTPTLNEGFSGVESAVSVAHWNDNYLFRAGEKSVAKNNVAFTDPDFLKMFAFPLLKGDVNHALENPNSIVLTEKFAKQLFGDKEAFGEAITLSQSGMDIPFTVTGILKDLPSNTDFHFEYLLSWNFMESNYGKDTQWGNNSVTTFVKLKEGASLATLNDEIKDLKKKNTKGEDNTELFLYPFTQNHLYSGFENGVQSGGRIEIVRMLGILGACLVIIACINFINLSTARAARRTKEVAVRKVTGAYRQSLISQFLCESLLVAFAAGVISLVAVYVLLPSFNALMNQHLILKFSDYAFWASIVVIIFGVGILAGAYPAFYLSAFQPVKILKGGLAFASNRNFLRNLLVIFQFGFAITLIVSTFVVYQQTMFVQNRASGYEKNNLIYQYNTGDLIKNFQSYKRELIETGTALSVTRTSSPITERVSNTSFISWRGKDPENKKSIERFAVDEDVSKTAGIQIIAGRDMDLSKYPADSTAVLLNETAVTLMGFKDPLGEVIEDNGIQWHVVGVVKDFVLTSPYQKVEPMVLEGSQMEKNGMLGVVHIRFNPSNSTKDNLEVISQLNAKYNPDYPFEYHFVDSEYERKFANTQTTLTLTSVFTGLAIFIGCLGLLGLSTYMIESRIKEIGIRKVMGGSVMSIIRLLSGHSMKPILWAIVLFSPGAWFGMNWWLQSFYYRIDISPLIFIASALLILE